MTYIPTEKVESSNIEEIGYHRQTSTLRIIFQENRAYDYPMVPNSEYQKLMQAESKGRFFNTRIKPMYGHRTVRPEQLQPPPEPCCNHPDKSCNDDDCGTCDPGCCPQAKGHLGQAVAHGVDRGKRLIEDARSTAASGVPPALPRTPEGEVDYEAIPDATAALKEIAAAGCDHSNKEAISDGSIVSCADCAADLSSEEVARLLDGTPTEEREAVIDTVCRCCGRSIRIPPEDAVALCGLCFGGKSGDTNEQCTEHPERRDVCPHDADGRDCETSACGCACHTGASD